jgi:hypothetical protein
MNTDQKDPFLVFDNLLLASSSLKSWSSAIQLISTIGGTFGVIAFIYECFSDVNIAILSVGLVSVIASALTGFLIAKCLEAGSMALQSLSIIQNTTTNKSYK